jgi:hypothetical protein
MRDATVSGRDRPGGPSNVVIHVVADEATVQGNGDEPGVLVGSEELIPAQMVAELAETARQRPLIDPVAMAPEPGYRPSARLADFIRSRDLTCRAPGCDCPATECDNDHTIPFGESGLTHPSNLKCLCCRASSDRHAGEHVERGEQSGGGVPGYHHHSGPSRRHLCRSASAARTAASLTR